MRESGIGEGSEDDDSEVDEVREGADKGEVSECGETATEGAIL